jgi:hypothetical protein
VCVGNNAAIKQPRTIIIAVITIIVIMAVVGDNNGAASIQAEWLLLLMKPCHRVFTILSSVCRAAVCALDPSALLKFQ